MPPASGDTKIPNWFIAFLSFVVVCAVPWAWMLQSDVSAIKAEIKGSYRLIDSKFHDVDRRIESHDRRIERLEHQ